MDRPDAEIEREAMAAVEEALDQPSDERSDYLCNHKTLSEPARARALALLRGQMGEGKPLLTGGAYLMAEDEDHPERIGAYRVLRLIGRGGMGNVYLAERATDDFDLLVAIKLIKQRLITGEMVARFRRERQILADLNHPNIARLFDGGETEDGSPYFVMEYVEGQPLDHWLEQAPRDMEKRIAVFRQVCSAVEAAHQRLVIHRDLTPPNILVCDENAVKLIDFGIARPDGDGRPPGDDAQTPGFAAPELGENGMASTLSDIYSLGKLLSMLIGVDGPDELSAIAEKASSEDPGDRYASVSALAEDIENYIDRRPVEALGRRPIYVMRKFVQRQTTLAVAVTACLAAIVVALFLIAQAYRQTELARARAEASLEDTRSLATAMMFDVFDEVSSRPGNSAARIAIARNAHRHFEAMARDPDATAAARLTAGRGFYRLAAATGTLDVSNRGELTSGIALYERSAEILESLYADIPSDRVRLALARTHINLSRDKLLGYIDIPQSRIHGERAQQLLLDIEEPSAGVVAALGRADRHLADVLICCTSETEAGFRILREGLARIRAAPEAVRTDPAVRRAFHDLRNIEAGAAIVAGRPNQSISIFRSALAGQNRLASQTDAAVDQRLEATIATNLAKTLIWQGRASEAEAVIDPIYRRTLAAYEADPDDNDLQRRLSLVQIVRARVAAELGDGAGARRLLEQGLHFARVSERSEGADSIPSLNYAHRLQEASEVYWANSQFEEACRTMRQSMSFYTRYAEGHDLPMTSLRYRVAPMSRRLRSCA